MNGIKKSRMSPMKGSRSENKAAPEGRMKPYAGFAGIYDRIMEGVDLSLIHI